MSTTTTAWRAGSRHADDVFVTVVIEEKNGIVGTSRLMMMFGAKDFQLQQWTVTDPQGYDTTVAVYNLDTTQAARSQPVPDRLHALSQLALAFAVHRCRASPRLDPAIHLTFHGLCDAGWTPPPAQSRDDCCNHMPLKITTWNINSVRLRIDLVAKFIKAVRPDVLCLQETKCPDDAFPLKRFKRLGYEHIALNGQKGYHGVAVISRLPFEAFDSAELSAARPIAATSSAVLGERAGPARSDHAA